MNKLIIALILCVSAPLAFGADKAPPDQNPFALQGEQLPDVPLTAASVQKLISSFGALRAEFKDFKPSGDGQGVQHWQGNEAAFRKAESIVREAGFKDLADWSAHFSKTTQAYMAYKMRETGKVNQAQIEQQIKAVQDDPNLTAEQKQMALNMMGMANMYTQMAASVPEADLKTLEPYIGQLEQVMRKEPK